MEGLHVVRDIRGFFIHMDKLYKSIKRNPYLDFVQGWPIGSIACPRWKLHPQTWIYSTKY
jgi:hypothetical protein